MKIHTEEEAKASKYRQITDAVRIIDKHLDSQWDSVNSKGDAILVSSVNKHGLPMVSIWRPMANTVYRDDHEAYAMDGRITRTLSMKANRARKSA